MPEGACLWGTLPHPLKVDGSKLGSGGTGLWSMIARAMKAGSWALGSGLSVGYSKVPHFHGPLVPHFHGPLVLLFRTGDPMPRFLGVYRTSVSR